MVGTLAGGRLPLPPKRSISELSVVRVVLEARTAVLSSLGRSGVTLSPGDVVLAVSLFLGRVGRCLNVPPPQGFSHTFRYST